MTRQLVEFIKLPNGTLRIKRLRDKGVKQEIRDIQADDNRGIEAKFRDIIEYNLCNGWTWIYPEEVAALTDAPIFSDDVHENSQGEYTWVGDTWWLSQYAVCDEVQELLERGYVDLAPAPENGQKIVGCATLDHLFYHEHCLPGNEVGNFASTNDEIEDSVHHWISDAEAGEQGYICHRCGEALASPPRTDPQPSQTGYPSHNGRGDGWGQ